jgi:hypothetical protein
MAQITVPAAELQAGDIILAGGLGWWHRRSAVARKVAPFNADIVRVWWTGASDPSHLDAHTDLPRERQVAVCRGAGRDAA